VEYHLSIGINKILRFEKASSNAKSYSSIPDWMGRSRQLVAADVGSNRRRRDPSGSADSGNPACPGSDGSTSSVAVAAVVVAAAVGSILGWAVAAEAVS
jgi:hypothetical protein